MPLTITVTRGFTMVAATPMSVDDWNLAFLPNIVLAGSVGASDLEDGSIDFSHLGPNVFYGLPELTALAGEDFVPVYDYSAGANKRIAVSNALNGIFGLAPESLTFTAYATDFVTYYNGTAAKRMPMAYLAEQLIVRAPELTTTSDADGVLVADASAAAGSKAVIVSLANLLPDKATAGTYTGPTQIVIDAKGRVTSIVTSGTGARTSSTIESTENGLPSSGGLASALVVAHGLAGRPAHVAVWLKCVDAAGDAGWDQNDVVRIEAVSWDTGGTDHNPHYLVVADPTNIRVIQPASVGATGIIPNKSTGADDVFTPSKWRALVSAIR